MERARAISAMIDARKRLLGIDAETERHMRIAAPFLHEALDQIVEDLYSHLLQLPEAAKLLSGRRLGVLKAKQKEHWRRLFDCKLDAAYVEWALRVGQVHFDAKVPSYVYLGAYGFMQSLIAARLTKAWFGRDELMAIQSSLQRVIMLDIDLALASYTRALWSGGPSDRVFV